MSNYICAIGALPLGMCGLYWNSHIMIIVSTIGVLFHINPKNNLLDLLDLSINTSLSTLACYQNLNILPVCFAASSIFIVNHYLYHYTNINKNIINIQHVIFVQGLGLYGYYMIYCQPIRSFIFFKECHYYLDSFDQDQSFIGFCCIGPRLMASGERVLL